MIEAVLFDLDGTLIDTAPDMGDALNRLLIEEGHTPLPMETIRPQVSRGGLVLTRLAFGSLVAEVEIEPLRLRFLQHYHDGIANRSSLFPGMSQVLTQLEEWGIPWGIVTNKPEWLTLPLLEKLDLEQRCQVMIGGDTLKQKKPHPLPLLTAARRLSVKPDHCIYVGDDERDIVAGKAACMQTVVAAYGYIEIDTNINAWQADAIIASPLELLQVTELDKHDTTFA